MGPLNHSDVENARSQLVESSRAIAGAADSLAKLVCLAADVIAACYGAGGKVVTCGNGGSGADSLHIAAELAGRFLLARPALAALSLCSNPALLTAISNDMGYELSFARQAEALVRRGDVLVALSTSGRSQNILCAVDAARRAGATVVGLTGSGGGPLAGRSDICLAVPSDVTPRVQEAHLAVGHTICALVERSLFGEARGSAAGGVP